MELEPRSLDGCYFKINDKNLCFSDLTEEQQDSVMEARSEDWLKSLCKVLAKTIRRIGDQFDIIGSSEDDDVINNAAEMNNKK